MKNLRFAIVLAATCVLAGCGKKQSELVTYGSKESLDANRAAAKAAPHGGQSRGGGHAHRPLMGGELVELGEHQFNLELKFDAARGMLQAWVLDGHAENFIRVGMASFDIQEAGAPGRTVTLHATANSMTGETVGDTSSFEGEAAWLREFKHFDGVIKAVRVRGVEFRDIRFHLHPTGT